MGRQGFAPVQDQVGVRAECDLLTVGQDDTAARPDGCHDAGDSVGIYRLGLFAGQPEQHGPVAAVTVAGGTQRAKQFAVHSGRPGQRALVGEQAGEPQRRAHRADGMRTGGTDADGE